MDLLYVAQGFAVECELDDSWTRERICLMCGCKVVPNFLDVHRTICKLPVPFVVLEYARKMGVSFRNLI